MANAPTVKEPTDGNAGTTVKAGAPDFVHVAQLLKGTHSTEKIQPSAIDGLSTEHASYKSPVRVASPVNIDLASASDPGAIDGVTLANNNRILLKAQTLGKDNGIYKCVNATNPTTWIRDSDFTDSSDVNSGLMVISTEGTEGEDKIWILTTNGVIVLGTTSLSFKRYAINPPNIIEIASAADFDDLASGGIVNITTSTTFILKILLSTSNRIVVSGSGVALHIVADFNSNGGFSYSGSDTFLTVTGGATLRILASARIFSSSTGTMLSMSGGGTFNLRDTAILGWDNLGTFADGIFFNFDISFINCDVGFVITNSKGVNSTQCDQSGSTMTGDMYMINSNDPATSVNITEFFAKTLSTTSALITIKTSLNNKIIVHIQNSTTVIGTLFKQTQITNAEILSVASHFPEILGDVTAFADDGNGNTIVFVVETTYYEDQEIKLTGTNIDGTYQIFDVVTNISFKVKKAFVADQAIANAISTKLIEMTLVVGHAVTVGMNIKVIKSQFYNKFYTVLNLVSTDVILVNTTFVATDLGEIERNVGLDETDPRVNGDNNGLEPDSENIAFGTANANATLTTFGAIDTYVPINLTALMFNEVSERFRLIDAATGKWMYTGLKTFKGFLTGALWVKKTGTTEKYRFAMSTNGAIPVFATASYAPVEVKTVKVPVPLDFLALLNEGDTIQMMSAGEGTTDSLTIEDIRLKIK